ncbi:MAG: YchF/TatD family DNA exonuclease [Candidatus Omnitrophica bacterium]|nr:YchF/TatD family DNA exonuclease [Candidatus Omnitrophota bacterium]
MLIDTHCHLDFDDFAADRDAVIERAKQAGVGAIIDVGSSVEGSRRALKLAESSDIIYASLGVHPHDAKSVTDKVIADFKEMAKSDKVVAIGEVGLDFYRNLSPKEEQEAAFRKFIRLAGELDLPLIIHAREAAPEVIRILTEEKRNGLRGVMHCFSGDKDFLQRSLEIGLHISFTCNITFKNAGALREVVREVPTERLLLETDAPFLAPQKLRGKRNEPAYLTYLVKELASITGLSENDIARITTHNAASLFKLFPPEQSKIAYEIRDSLYLNITNRCTNNCDFCIRSATDFVKGHNLKLEKEPSADEILKAIGDPARYKEIVFCGYGEPTMRLDIVKTVAKEVKAKGARTRLVTNGHGDLINSRPIAGELAGLIDKVSVSLNADTQEKYDKICAPQFGPESFKRVVDFIKDCAGQKIETEVTCLDLPGVDIKKCEEIARSAGAGFRLRRYGVTG